MMKRLTIFEQLSENNICFAVVVSQSQFTDKSDLFDRDYFIIISDKDRKKVRRLDFNQFQNSDVCERNLSEKEIREFKSKINDFQKVIHNEHGRVYELKDNSFKEYFEELKLEKAI